MSCGKRRREDEDKVEEDFSAYAMSTTLSWSKLSASTQEMFEEGLACVGEECVREAPRLERRAATRAAAPSASCLGRSSVSLHHSGVHRQAAQAGVMPRPSGRVQLDRASAVRIFLAKHASAEALGSKSDLSGRLALEYCVTPKAVRDIWNGRTWRKATQPFWSVLGM